MQKSTTTLTLHTELFNPDSYSPANNLSNRKNYWHQSSTSFAVYVYGSSFLNQNESLIPLAYLDYAQITIFLDLSIYFNLDIQNRVIPIKAIFGIHNNPIHYSGMYLTI